MARNVIELVPARLRAKKRPPLKRKKKPPNPDVRARVTDRTFEVVCVVATSEYLQEKRVRIRVKKGGLEDNVFSIGTNDYYAGMVSEHTVANKWTEYSWGHVATSFACFVREIESREPPHVVRRDKDGSSSA